MAETILIPVDDEEPDPLRGFNLDAFDEDNPEALNALLGSLTEADEHKIGFSDLPIASPYAGQLWRSRPFLRSELQPGNAEGVAETRAEIASEMRYRYGEQELIEDAKIITSELATNALIHGGAEEEDVAIAGIFRARTIRGGVVFEAANAAAVTHDSQAATERGSHEKGNGFEIVQALAADHGGQVGRYKVVSGLFGRERIVTDPDEIRRVQGRWVVWATFRQNVSGAELAA